MAQDHHRRQPLPEAEASAKEPQDVVEGAHRRLPSLARDLSLPPLQRRGRRLLLRERTRIPAARAAKSLCPSPPQREHISANAHPEEHQQRSDAKQQPYVHPRTSYFPPPVRQGTEHPQVSHGHHRVSLQFAKFLRIRMNVRWIV